jgi:hypothetical protein
MRSKRPQNSPTRPKPANTLRASEGSFENDPPTLTEIADLAVDIWKLGERAKTEGASDRMIAAYERAEGRLKRIGFELDSMVGKPYDTNLKARVIDHESGEGPVVIGQCISPAVFFRGRLVREAEIVTKGCEDKK